MASTFTPTWLKPDDVARWLRLNAGAPATEDDELVRVCVQTEAYVQRCRPEWHSDPDPAVPGDTATYTPDAETYQGAVMYAAREYRRRNSPAGIEAWAEGGAVFVAKYDADIERALRTGQWNVPGVG
jgi:hypothetical protein